MSGLLAEIRNRGGKTGGKRKSMDSRRPTQAVEDSFNGPARDHPKLARFFRMLKMRVPMGAVEAKMRAEGIDVALADLDPDKPVPAGTFKAAKADDDSRAKASTEDLTVVLSKHSSYGPFFQRLAAGEPREVVAEAMQGANVIPDVLDCDPKKPLPKRFHGFSFAQWKIQARAQQKRQERKLVRRRLFLKPVSKAAVRAAPADCVWENDVAISKSIGWPKPSGSAESIPGFDQSQFEKLFTMTRKKKSKKRKGAAGSGPRPDSSATAG